MVDLNEYDPEEVDIEFGKNKEAHAWFDFLETEFERHLVAANVYNLDGAQVGRNLHKDFSITVYSFFLVDFTILFENSSNLSGLLATLLWHWYDRWLFLGIYFPNLLVYEA